MAGSSILLTSCYPAQRIPIHNEIGFYFLASLGVALRARRLDVRFAHIKAWALTKGYCARGCMLTFYSHLRDRQVFGKIIPLDTKRLNCLSKCVHC